jgi:NAD+ kinase
MMLEGTLEGRDSTAYALNDVVFSRSGSLRLISINVYVDGQFLNTLNADGVIVSTPTGSTAYNLSAGGPIVEPTGSIIVMTPICPQSMYARSLVFSAKDLITLELAHSPHGDENEAEASFDGRRKMILREGDRIGIRKSGRTLRLLRISRQSFLQTLHKKLSRAEGFS